MQASTRQEPSRILVVDDDPGLRRLMEKNLARAGHATASAGSARETLAWLDSNAADLMLLDLKLPDAVGADVIEQLESRGKRPPFIVITGQGDERVAVEMMKRGALDYLVKDKEFLEGLLPVIDRVLTRLRMENRLAAAEQQIRLIKAAVEGSQDAVLITSAEKPQPKIVYGNPAFYRLTGLDAETATGKSLDLLEPQVLGCFRRALAKNRPLAGEDRLSSRDGETRILECQVSPIKNGQGIITNWVCIQRDITERKAAEKALNARVRQQAAVAYLGNRVLAGITLDALLDEAAQLLVETIDTGFSQVMELLPGEEEFLLRAGAGWRRGYKGHARSPNAGSPAGLAITSRDPVIYENLLQDTRMTPPPFLVEHEVKSGIVVPVHDRERPFGVLAVGTREIRRFTGDDVHFLQAMANVVSEALERRRSEKEILEASAREQQRIGQDLHDGLGQHLTGIELLSHCLEEELADAKLPQAAQAGKIASRVREAISQTRYLARGLSPVHVEADGLMEALRELAASVAEIFGIACRFYCPSPVLLADNNAATHLYRIAQEATNNAIKHGKAKNITISLVEEEGQRQLEIADDGAGFSQESGTGGIGLRIMKRRATMIGGRFEIVTKPEGGVRAICTIPARN